MPADIFIKIGDIKGESKDHKHKDEIEVLSWGWGMSQGASTHGGGGSGTGKVHVNDLHFSKQTDSSTHMLISSCCRGTHHKEATLCMRKAGHDALEYVIIKMKEVYVTSVNMDGHGSEIPMESISLRFAEYEYAYQPQKKDGSADGGKKEFKFSIEEHNVK